MSENGLYYVKKCKELLDQAESIGNTYGTQINEVRNGYLDCIVSEFKRVDSELLTAQTKADRYEKALTEIKDKKKPCNSHCVECSLHDLESSDCFCDEVIYITTKALEG